MSPRDLSVGSWVFGKDAEYDPIQTTILEADAIITLRADFEIEWYDFQSDTWQVLTTIELLRKRLEAVSGRSHISVGTERPVAPASKEAEYIHQIAGYAKELGYGVVVVMLDQGDDEEIVIEITDVIDLTE